MYFASQDLSPRSLLQPGQRGETIAQREQSTAVAARRAIVSFLQAWRSVARDRLSDVQPVGGSAVLAANP
jgi:hypothetical protein